MSQPQKRCIVFSYGPVPTPEQDKVEGGGLRCWGLAKGLSSQSNDVDLTVAYHESYKKEPFTADFESIHVTTWNESSIEELISGYDTIVVSYCMGDLSVNIANIVKPNQQLVLDCYVPIYTEISARGSEDVEGEYKAFENEVVRWAAVLRRGDLYLCANENQKRYYQGVLSALGRLNPATYQDELIIVVPYGVYRDKPVIKSKPITEILKEQKSENFKKILWFGAVYPWFDLRTLIDAVNEVNKKLPAKLIIVGAKNPFNAHPDFVARYEELMAYINSSEKNKEHIILQDWVDFNDRADWYQDSDLVILINKIGSENELAWRTRLVDYIWADLPIVTNAGDPLGEELVALKAASKLEDLSVAGLASGLTDLLNDPKKLKDMKLNLAKVRNKYYWDEVTKLLYAKIMEHSRPTDFTRFGLLETVVPGAASGSLIGRVMSKAKKVPDYYTKYGARITYNTLKTVGLQKLNGVKVRSEPKVIFVAHQLDTTGAPHVFVDMLKDFKHAHTSVQMEFHTFNPADRENIKALNTIGIKPKIHVSRDIALQYAEGDVVVLNTVAFSDIMRDSIYTNLDNGTIKKLIWYVHEDEPEYIFGKAEASRIRALMQRDLITIFTAAKQTRDNYISFFGSDSNIKHQMYRVKVAKKYHNVRPASDFDTIRFSLPGMVGDGRKGQLPLIYAFIEFKKRFYDVSPDKYRDFSLAYIGVGSDFLSRQLLKHTDAGLGTKFRHYPAMSHQACMDLVQDANFTICYSMRECLPMFVYEGMISGHAILRNDSSGMDEQLIDEKNGYYLDSKDFEQLIGVIEKVCNKTTTTNSVLSKMSKVSYDIVSKQENTTYDEINNSVADAFKNN